MLGACAPNQDAIGHREEAVLNGVASFNRAVVGFSFHNATDEHADCSGSFVGSHLILTAYHCAFENNTTPMTFEDATDGELGMRHPA
ncbi:MAG: hypothetical protein KAI47_22405, partial [Deltaproteobacteria bacterium]|nr:hypothetical protein [Deltaproteobacteria bacterium]